ncbi:MAG TPA: hypothetical protein VF521_01075 [Pyrinomonadaceae bacterium]
MAAKVAGELIRRDFMRTAGGALIALALGLPIKAAPRTQLARIKAMTVGEEHWPAGSGLYATERDLLDGVEWFNRQMQGSNRWRDTGAYAEYDEAEQALIVYLPFDVELKQ